MGFAWDTGPRGIILPYQDVWAGFVWYGSPDLGPLHILANPMNPAVELQTDSHRKGRTPDMGVFYYVHIKNLRENATVYSLQAFSW